MKRFQMERALMAKRWRQEWEQHGRDFGNCHCGRGMGTMRKHRPHESCGCATCAAIDWCERRARRKHRRQDDLKQIIEGQTDG